MQAVKVKVGLMNTEQLERKVGDTILLEAEFLDSSGNPAAVDGMPVWVSSNPGILEVQGSGADATVLCLTPGLAEVTCYADADMSAGVRNIAGRIAVNVTSREAETVNIIVKE